MVGNMSWLPVLPQLHCLIALHKVLDPKPVPKLDDPNTKKKSAQVHKLNMSSCFKQFKTGINSNKFNDLIKKVGPPPSKA